MLTGAGGSNPALFTQNFRFIGGDTQLLGNFEYRIPIFGPATLAAFADVGSVFNLRKTGTQTINSEFLPDDTFHRRGPPDGTWADKRTNLESSFGSILYYRGRVLDQDRLYQRILPRQPLRLSDQPVAGGSAVLSPRRRPAEFAAAGR